MSEARKVFNDKNRGPISWFRDKPEFSNHYCLYCGAFLADKKIPSNREHLIGREFVPSNSFDEGRAFNFIFRACVQCNSEKSQAERHISSISLYSSHARVDPEINALAIRKASKDFHPLEKGKLVCDAHSKHNFSLNKNELSIDLKLIGPPQPDYAQLQVLAFRHIQGLFSLVTSEDPLKPAGINLLPPRNWWFGGAYPCSDWGNPSLIEIAERVKGWETPLYVITANGYFRSVLRIGKGEKAPWVWALEWNKSWRCFGGICDPENLPQDFLNLPETPWIAVDSTTRIRPETPLTDENDNLFFIQD